MITQADIDATKKIMVDMLIAGAQGDHDAWRIAAENAQRERDAVIADSFKFHISPNKIARAIRDQAATPLQNGGVG